MNEPTLWYLVSVLGLLYSISHKLVPRFCNWNILHWPLTKVNKIPKPAENHRILNIMLPKKCFLLTLCRKYDALFIPQIRENFLILVLITEVILGHPFKISLAIPAYTWQICPDCRINNNLLHFCWNSNKSFLSR